MIKEKQVADQYNSTYSHSHCITIFLSKGERCIEVSPLLCYVYCQVGTVDPVGDFRTLISQRDEDRFDEGMLSPQSD